MPLTLPTVGTTLRGRYRLDAELGRGGMGRVFRARDLELERDVAVKVLEPLDDGAPQDAALREARLAARLNHPGVVAVYDVGEDDGTPFLVMELVEGPALRSRVPLEPDQAIAVALQVCEALEHAHAHGLVHRDVKPENLLVVGDGEPLRVKLADLGISSVQGATRSTQTDALLGTASYLAPEQALGLEADARADVYALGAVLYELVCGRPPFVGDGPIAVISQHLHAPVVPPSTHRAGLAPALDAALLRALAKDRTDRFGSARELAQALAGLLEARPEAVAPAAPAVAIGQLAPGRLVGRRAEFERLVELWAESQHGHAHMAMLSGEPGVGKTRLAREFVVYAHLQGAAVLQGGCYEFEASTAYLPWVEALRRWAEDLPTDRLRETLGASAPVLARLAPSLAARLGPLPEPPALSPQEERLRLFDACARLLQTLAARSGLLLFLDDLHWADHGTLALLHYVLRNHAEARVLVLGTYREVELDRTRPLVAQLPVWDRERLASRIALDRLSRADTSRMLATLFGQETVSSDFAEALHRETEGNPFFVEEVVKSLVEQEQIYRDRGAWQRKDVGELTIPQSIKAAIGRRLDRLTPECLKVLQAAAALGKVFAYEPLAAVVDASEDAVLDALDQAREAQLIRVEKRVAFAFTHDKIREVLRDELNPIRLRRLHLRIGQVLETMHADEIEGHAADLAYHFVEGGDLEKGLTYSLAAAREAERVYAIDEALESVDRAELCMDTLRRAEVGDQIEELRASLLAQRGEFVAAGERYELLLARATDPARRALLHTTIGDLYARVGDPRGREHLRTALETLDPETQRDQRASALGDLGRYHHYEAKHLEAVELLMQAVEITDERTDPEVLTHLYAYLAGAYQHLGRFDESIAWAERCIAVGERSGHPGRSAVGHEFIAEDHVIVGRWEEGLAHAEKDHELGLRAGSLDRVAWSGYARGIAKRRLADLQGAADETLGAQRMAETLGEKRLSVLAGAEAAVILLELGRVEEAHAKIDEVQPLAEATGQFHMLFTTLDFRIEMLAREERWEEAWALYGPAREMLGEKSHGFNPALLGAHAGDVLLRLAPWEEAAEQHAAYRRAALSIGAEYLDAIMAREWGAALVRRGELEPGLAELDASAEVLERTHTWLELARTLAGRATARRGRDEAGARADRERAREILERAGARFDLERLDRDA